MSDDVKREIGEMLASQPLGWADLIAQRDEAWAQRDQAQRFAVAFSSECAALEQERDDALLAAEVATGTPCWRCGGAA